MYIYYQGGGGKGHTSQSVRMCSSEVGSTPLTKRNTASSLLSVASNPGIRAICSERGWKGRARWEGEGKAEERREIKREGEREGGGGRRSYFNERKDANVERLVFLKRHSPTVCQNQ